MNKGSLVFEEEKHQYFWQGNLVPSVTQILDDVGLWPDYSVLDPWYADRGSKVHKAVALWEKGRLSEDVLDDQIVPYLESYKLWKEFTKYEPEIIEVPAYSLSFNFAGTPDSFGKVSEDSPVFWWRDVVLDLKCGPFNIFFGFQLAGYSIITEQHWKWKRVSLHLQNDGSIAKHRVHDDPDDFHIFKSAVTVYHAKRRIK